MPPGRSQKGRGTFSCYHLTSQTACTACLSEQRENLSAFGRNLPGCMPPLFQPDNGCCDPAQPTETPCNRPFGARLRDVFAVRFPRASHLPAAFCAVPRTVTCSLLCLGYTRNYLRANIPHYKGVTAKCQVPPAITSRSWSEYSGKDGLQTQQYSGSGAQLYLVRSVW